MIPKCNYCDLVWIEIAFSTKTAKNCFHGMRINPFMSGAQQRERILSELAKYGYFEVTSFIANVSN